METVKPLAEQFKEELDELYSLAWQDGHEGLNRRGELHDKFVAKYRTAETEIRQSEREKCEEEQRAHFQRVSNKTLPDSFFEAYESRIRTDQDRRTREEVERLLNIYSVTAPESSRAATFTPEQFMKVFTPNPKEK